MIFVLEIAREHDEQTQDYRTNAGEYYNGGLSVHSVQIAVAIYSTSEDRVRSDVCRA
jgi:hypothetical protein